MVMRLFTPGHGDPLDTLIVNGIVLSMVEEYPNLKIDVLKQASRFVIKIYGETSIDEGRIIENAKSAIIEDCKLGSIGKIGIASTPQPATPPERTIKKIDRAFSCIKSSFLKEYSDEAHLIKNNEGRGRKGKNLFKAHIQIAPFAGSYSRLPYVTVGTASGASFKVGGDYVICPICLIFSWAGLVKSASIITYSSKERKESKKKKKSSLFLLPSPIKATQDDIAFLSLIFGEKAEIIGSKQEIPALGGILYSIVSGETIGSLSPKSLLEIIYWVYVKEGNFIGVRDFGSVPFLNLYKFVLESKRRSPYLVKIINAIADQEPELLELLVESLLFPGYNAYNIIRSLWAFLEKSGRAPLDPGIVDALVNLIERV